MLHSNVMDGNRSELNDLMFYQDHLKDSEVNLFDLLKKGKLFRLFYQRKKSQEIKLIRICWPSPNVGNQGNSTFAQLDHGTLAQ